MLSATVYVLFFSVDREQHKMSSSAFLLVLLSAFCTLHVYGQHVDTFCILQYCTPQMKACVLDTPCKEALICLQSCGTSILCEFMCLNSYDDPQFDAFVKCTAVDHNCIQLGPDKPFQCKKPTSLDTNFTLLDLQGTWYTVKGLNTITDCFNCQSSTYNISQPYQGQVKKLFDAVTDKGAVKHLETEETVIQNDPKIGAILNFSSIEYGLKRQEEYRILDYSKDQGFVLGYTCSAIASLVYEGAFVYSRSPTLTPAALSQVTSSAASHGYNISTFCSPHTTGCTSQK